MAEPIRIVIPGPPATYQKKTGMWHSKDGRSGTNAYDAKGYAKWRDYARGRAAEIADERKGVLLDGPVVVVIRAYFLLPMSASQKQRRLAFAGLIRPTRKPDFDNLAKACADSVLTGLFIRDDRQIVSGSVEKWWDERPRVEIEVRPWEPVTMLETPLFQSAK